MAAVTGHHDWEPIASNEGHDSVERMRVPGGWIYRNMVLSDRANNLTLALTFVPRAPSFPSANAGLEPH